MRKPEILAPAGNMESLETACLYGADAVYLGVRGPFNLRARAKNFTLEELEMAVGFAHSKGVKIYLTLNTFPRERQLQEIEHIISGARDIGVDAFIISDLGIFMLARRLAPRIPIHISTQSNTVNSASANAWAELGAQRIILARELNHKEIAEIRAKTNTELEIFVHGSICISISGRCLISNYLAERDANQGFCAQPCRWEYALVEKSKPKEYMPVLEKDGFTYLYNSKDLCLLPVMDRVMRLSIDGLKIEGRSKTALYVATTVSTYKKARDAWLEDPGAFKVDKSWMEELLKISNRDYFTGFFEREPSIDGVAYDLNGYIQEYHLAAKVLGTEGGIAIFEARNPLVEGMEMEWLPSDSGYRSFILKDPMVDGEKARYIKPNQVFTMKTPFRPKRGELVRKPYSEGDRMEQKEEDSARGQGLAG